jgi:methylmalonyl-CoA mutase
MAKNNIKLFEEFPPISTKDWQEKISADLKGKDYEKTLVWRTNEGFNVQPYYRQEDLENVKYLNQLPGQFPYVRGTKTEGNNWLIRQDIMVTDFELANKKALEVMYKGINSLGFILQGDVTVDDLGLLLKDICLDSIELNIVTCSNSIDLANALSQYITNTYGAEAKIKASINIDPIASLTKNGALNNEIFGELKNLVDSTASMTEFSVVGVNGKVYRDAGSSIVQEVSFSLASGTEYMTQLTEAGSDALTIAKKIKFSLGVGTNYFMEIAKLRAIRLLWSKIVETFDSKCADEEYCKAAEMNIHSENTVWNKTVYDPHVNLLRTQTEAMSAVLGGTDSLTILPFNAIYEEASDFSERIARNQQILLKEEAHFDKISDPAAGSYYLENLTDQIAEQAWKLFLEVQNMGGYIAAFKAGFIQSSIEATSSKLDQSIATRRKNLLGTNQFPNFNEYMQNELDQEVFSKRDNKSDNAIAEPLKRYRGAQVFETLRYTTDVYSRENKRPLVFMLTIGSLNMRKARSQFASNFFAVAGFDVTEGKGYATVEEGVADAKLADANIVVICSSDDEYAEFAPASKELLTDEIFVVAGFPKCKEELESKGINNFIHVRSNLLEELIRYQKELNI